MFDKRADKLNQQSRSNAGPTPFHRRGSYLPFDTKQGRFKWLIYDNDGSFNGWFDWLPLHLRVGYWSPLVVLSLVLCYTAILQFKPKPLEFPPFVLFALEEEESYFMGMPMATAIDLFIFVWGVSVVIYGRIKLGSLGAFPISFTGWSWFLLASRAGLELMAWVAFTNDHMRMASTFATLGSSIRFVTITNACVVCTIWNFILFPLIYFKSVPAGEKRRDFLRFNFSWFMTNIHILNFPLSCFNIIYGDESRVRLFTESDLWVAYAVVLLYSVLYYFLMDRLGLHFYPIFNPRTAFSLVSIAGVLGLYYFLFLKWNEYIGL